ncbi:putative Peroxidase 48 isoform X1 [Papaver somniferum]|uniref:putative Peroxidase 48 isoform X1 n=1 Tax=Papaver somniferum TaxID=3469 RepID=UPI000E6F697E|nr:putative Peroxidase 48 isoform X1 [Papaver somniferum]
MELPAPTDDLSVILSKFLHRNFNEQETVSLLGAHSIGAVNCKFILGRVNNFSGTGAPDPTIEIDFLKLMQAKCRGERAFIDLKNEGAAAAGFGTHFYQGLVQNKSVLRSDQQLMSEEKTATWVRAYATNNFLFIKDFSNAMIKLSNNGFLTGPFHGEIRLNCSSTL